MFFSIDNEIRYYYRQILTWTPLSSMKLNETIARQIVERTMKIIPYSVNVMDDQGRIIGSGDPSRLQQKHEG
ncbi:sugar diacid recognition domain-containing protein, partial [Vibrio vulnificus]|uniref:sugar diacid recognition domain-containing protein n=1 Tax=Vibrio vulnificus TaxID=672 RepID=UPI0023B172DF